MSPEDMERRVVRFGDLRPCRTAFIDAHTPGSDRKENFTIIGGGVSESPDQFVHLRETPGFNIGAAGQPPGCRNSLHAHRTAEVFFVHSGRWRFFWGLHGDAGEVVLEEGDMIDIPIGIFRGFENVGIGYGMLMAILGGDDAGGGVIWAPQVIEDARAHGLILAETGRLYDSNRGEALPEGVAAMRPLRADELRRYPELPVGSVVPRFIARYNDLMALAASEPARVINTHDSVIIDDPGFDVDFLRGATATPTADHNPVVAMVHRGHWSLRWDHGALTLAPGDVCAVPAGLRHTLAPCASGEAALFRVASRRPPATSLPSQALHSER